MNKNCYKIKKNDVLKSVLIMHNTDTMPYNNKLDCIMNRLKGVNRLPPDCTDSHTESSFRLITITRNTALFQACNTQFLY